jgi:hypothetical protein
VEDYVPPQPKQKTTAEDLLKEMGAKKKSDKYGKFNIPAVAAGVQFMPLDIEVENE